jgi:hypothetical protein
MTDQARTYRSAAPCNIGPGFKPGFYPNPFWDDQNFDVLSLTVPGNNSAPAAYVIPTTGITIPKFADGASITEAAGSKELEHAWKVGSSIYPHAHVLKLTAGAGSVFLGFEYRIALGTTVLYDTKTLTLPVTDVTVLTQLAFANLGEIALSAFTTIGAQVSFRFFRDPTNVADDFAGDIAITTVGWHFQRDTAGSRQVATK